MGLRGCAALDLGFDLALDGGLADAPHAGDGRVTDQGSDFGFVVSLGTVHARSADGGELLRLL